MRRYPRTPAVLVALAVLSLPLAAQVAKIAPEKPKWGDTITLAYDPGAEGAALLPGDAIYASWAVRAGGSVETGWSRMDKKGGVLECRVPVPAGAGHFSAYFLTMSSWDSRAFVGTMIYRPDGAPAQGAWQAEMTSAIEETKYGAAFDRERKLYPENHAVYRDKWWLDAFFKKDEIKAIVKRDMAELRRAAKKDSPGLLYALNEGYLLLDEEETARDVLRKLVSTYPDSPYTALALHDYDYQAFSKQLEGDGPAEVKKLARELLVGNPGARSLRDLCERAAWESDPPLDAVRAGLAAWIKEEPDNPRPYYALGSALLKRGGDLQEAAALLGQALNLLLQGKMRLYGDISGARARLELPSYLKTAAEIHEKLGDLAAALSEIKAAETMGKEARADLFLFEASVWRRLGDLAQAEETLLEAKRRGSAEAAAELMSLYHQRHESADGFEAWLAKAMDKHAAAAPGAKKQAPGFDVRTIDGQALTLAGLQGKVVVLNFWFIGCAPCRVEMPGLNKLVAEFGDGDVVFIGFALDKTEALEKFLKEIPFNYRIVPESSAIASQYGASAFPTHVIINKQGQIEFVLTGGSPTRENELRPLIRGLLK